MKKHRLLKMTIVDQNMLVKALCDQQKREEERRMELQCLAEKTLHAGKRLYLDDREFQCAALSLNGMRSAYLSAGRSSAGIDRLLLKLLNSRQKHLPAR